MTGRRSGSKRLELRFFLDAFSLYNLSCYTELQPEDDVVPNCVGFNLVRRLEVTVPNTRAVLNPANEFFDPLVLNFLSDGITQVGGLPGSVDTKGAVVNILNAQYNTLIASRRWHWKKKQVIDRYFGTASAAVAGMVQVLGLVAPEVIAVYWEIFGHSSHRSCSCRKAFSDVYQEMSL